MNNAPWLKSREIVERIIIQGDLVLETPAFLGSGDHEGLVDVPLILDPLEGKALLTGSTLAGALRSYLRERQYGYRNKGDKESLYFNLFGYQEKDEGEQSLLIVSDSLGEKPALELRDGVKIDPCTRTAEENKKYDYELIGAGTSFHIKLELLVQEKRRNELIRALIIALQGLENSEIPLGFRKRRGLGKCRVKEWKVCRYDLTKPDGLIAWLKNDIGGEIKDPKISSLLKSNSSDLDNREFFSILADFSLNGSMLIRSGFDDPNAPDNVHLHSNRNGKKVPVLSGTSLAGALRARALRIAKTLDKKGYANNMVEDLFGTEIKTSKDNAKASKLVTAETEITYPLNLVQTRVKIDRFTHGSFPAALFNEQPVFGKPETRIRLEITIQHPDNAQIGLLLLLLKDLWTEDLPLGGETGVGRGRLRGENATLTYKQIKGDQKWEIKKSDRDLVITGDAKECLEGFVNDFGKVMRE